MTATLIKNWSSTAGSNNSASPSGAPEGMAPSGVNDTIRQGMASVRDWYVDPAWIDLGYTYTYVSTTSFKVSGLNVTSDFVVGRRVRAVGASTGTIYGVITVSTFSTDTTVTLVWDSGTLANETLAISIGLPGLGSPISSRAIFNTETTIASATVTDLNTAKANVVSISGTTTILGFGSNASVLSPIYYVRFTGILTFTHDSVGLILPTGANITTAAGDTCIMKYEGSGNWRCINYMRKDGTALAGGGTYATLTANTFTGAQIGTVTALTSSGASIAINLATNNNFSHTLTENTTLANPSNVVAGQSGSIAFTQHASSPKTLAYGSNWVFAALENGGADPALTATNSALDVLSYYVVNSTTILAHLSKGCA